MISIRLALPVERRDLEQLQWRASLNNPGDRVALLANPDAIALPLEQIESLEQLRLLQNGYRIHVALVDEKSVEVDTPADLKRAELYLKRQLN